MGLLDERTIFNLALTMCLHRHGNTISWEEGEKVLQSIQREDPEFYNSEVAIPVIRRMEDRGWIRVDWQDADRTRWATMELLPAVADLLPPGHTFDGTCCH